MTGGTDGGPAGGDGLLEPEDVAGDVVQAMEEGKFLVLPHKDVLKYMRRKTSNYDRWLAGMQRLHNGFGKFMLRAPPMSAAKL